MAKAIPGIIITSIHGRMGNLVFYYRHGTQCVRTHVIPRNPDTEAQRTVRRTFGDAVRSWQALSADSRCAFIRRAHTMSMSGYNLYISEYMKATITGMRGTDTLSLTSDIAPLSFYLNPLTSVSKPYIKGDEFVFHFLMVHPWFLKLVHPHMRGGDFTLSILIGSRAQPRDNPRARVGRDYFRYFVIGPDYRFNPRARVGRD